MTHYRSTTDASRIYRGTATADHAGTYSTSDPTSFAEAVKNSIVVNVSSPTPAPTILPLTLIEPNED